MQLEKITTLLVVDSIEAVLPTWNKLGYSVSVRVPETGTLGFVILQGEPGELMLQTKRSLKEDLPAVAKLKPAHLLYADVKSLPPEAAEQAVAALERDRRYQQDVY